MEEQFYITKIYTEEELEKIERALSPQAKDQWRDELLDLAYSFILRRRYFPYPGKTKIIDYLTSTINKMNGIDQFVKDLRFEKTYHFNLSGDTLGFHKALINLKRNAEIIRTAAEKQVKQLKTGKAGRPKGAGKKIHRQDFIIGLIRLYEKYANPCSPGPQTYSEKPLKNFIDLCIEPIEDRHSRHDDESQTEYRTRVKKIHDKEVSRILKIN